MYTVADLINLILIITFVISVFTYKKYKNTPLKYFVYFLGYGIATEFLGRYFYDIFGFPNYILYNIYALIQFIYFLGLFLRSFKKRISKNTVKIFIVLCLVFFFINSFFYQNILKNIQSYFFLFGGIILIITILLFLIELLNSDSILKIKNLLIFWVAVGMFLFQLGFIPVFMANNYINYAHGITYGLILLILNVISCTCYILGFIWSKKEVDY